MNFERAGSEEKKSIRIGKITKAACGLIKSNKYEDTMMAGIARELSFTCADAYKYISTKEEIFHYIIAEDLKD